MSEGHGAAIAGFAVAGITYLFVESVVTFLLLGIAFGAFAVIVTAASIVLYVDIGSLFAFAWLAGTVLYLVPALYQRIEQESTPS